MSFLKNLFGEPIPIIQIQELSNLLTNGRRPYLLDVREPAEFPQGHIAGEKLVPLGQLGSRINELPKSHKTVCICATGHRSVPAARKPIAAGYNAMGLQDGVTAGQRAKPPIQRGGAST